jgi:hypothetical protein
VGGACVGRTVLEVVEPVLSLMYGVELLASRRVETEGTMSLGGSGVARLYNGELLTDLGLLTSVPSSAR